MTRVVSMSYTNIMSAKKEGKGRKKSMLKALIMDFDGTMIDSETMWWHTYQDWTRDNCGFEFPLDMFIKNAGSDGKEVFAELERRVGQKIDWAKMQEWSYQEMDQRANSLEPLPGVVELLKMAKEKELKISTGTSSREFRVANQLNRLDLMQYFDAMSTADQSHDVKPAPDVFLKAAELLGVEPEECLVIEDSANGLIAADRAGMRCIVVPNQITRSMDFRGAYKVVDSLEDLDLDEIMGEFEK